MTGTWVKGWVGTTGADSSMAHWKAQTLSGNRHFDAGEHARALDYYQQALWLARQQFPQGGFSLAHFIRQTKRQVQKTAVDRAYFNAQTGIEISAGFSFRGGLRGAGLHACVTCHAVN